MQLSVVVGSGWSCFAGEMKWSNRTSQCTLEHTLLSSMVWQPRSSRIQIITMRYKRRWQKKATAGIYTNHFAANWIRTVAKRRREEESFKDAHYNRPWGGKARDKHVNRSRNNSREMIAQEGRAVDLRLLRYAQLNRIVWKKVSSFLPSRFKTIFSFFLSAFRVHPFDILSKFRII